MTSSVVATGERVPAWLPARCVESTDREQRCHVILRGETPPVEGQDGQAEATRPSHASDRISIDSDKGPRARSRCRRDRSCNGGVAAADKGFGGGFSASGFTFFCIDQSGVRT